MFISLYKIEIFTFFYSWLTNMEIPIAVPVGFPAAETSFTPEVYELDQRRHELRDAEEDLKLVLDGIRDYFDSSVDLEETIRLIQEKPTETYKKPFMNKMAKAFLRVKQCKEAVQWASEAIVDMHFTPAQVKTQVKRLLIQQAVNLEHKMDARMEAMASVIRDLQAQQERTNVLVRHLQNELEEFQSKVKNFSEDTEMLFVYALQFHDRPFSQPWSPTPNPKHDFYYQEFRPMILRYYHSLISKYGICTHEIHNEDAIRSLRAFQYVTDKGCEHIPLSF